ncbi:hypothetical protein ARMGADRAFT_1092730 [Armillaria gallica]|uniref:Uncharacterized protein n=1 Tax=Armillaria gallica TaxID=47427 RepID=A0A2H3CL02_ARMGA|nr:hypothetical protein ARMGADRAFT_1092730 [Armillaria gallica]
MSEPSPPSTTLYPSVPFFWCDYSLHLPGNRANLLRRPFQTRPNNDGLQEWGENIITDGRDNKLHVWLGVEELPGIGGLAALSESPAYSGIRWL